MKQSVLKQPKMLANRPSNIALQALVSGGQQPQQVFNMN